MPTIALTVREYNDALVQVLLSTHDHEPEKPPGSPVEGRARNGNRGAGRGIPGPGQSLSGTRINTGDSRRVSVTPGPRPARLGGRPRRHASPAERNRVRQRRYRIRRAELRLDPEVARQKAYRATSGVQDRVRGARPASDMVGSRGGRSLSRHRNPATVMLTPTED
jgi:hypothetical protein